MFAGPILAIATVAFIPALEVLGRDWGRNRVVTWGAVSLVGLVVWVGWLRSGIIWPLIDRIPGVSFHETNLPFPGMDVTPTYPSVHEDPKANHRGWSSWPMGCDEQVVTRVKRTHVYFEEGDDTCDPWVGWLFASGPERFAWADVSDYSWEFKLFPFVGDG